MCPSFTFFFRPQQSHYTLYCLVLTDYSQCIMGLKDCCGSPFVFFFFASSFPRISSCLTAVYIEGNQSYDKDELDKQQSSFQTVPSVETVTIH